ncbi:hypothetical protein [Oharaeibacter diazotrophicus]|uniref:Uncharacterized protein n=2 Tax=Oharaeibacter diazotrophicus TaxID=1920512 RepID=A0A4R6RLP8_9HYPH|nr:hypothetical protein [Oharaeibacter diazotrophicus]TDP87470.1 hypothetical protein EDD54_1365 [Oharaeibacter diazotrophicus]BBE70586.1 hypothetical protein OHA_1_00150 [Pleomorphomonas sp. SM30]GLS77332.1 hypothetical protein GCM10007904_26690 [Oharaeibacter diazotrophicus]
MTAAVRIALALAAAAALAAGLAGGLARLGLSPAPMSAVEQHGALMVGGFFGVLIALERAVAAGSAAALAVPALGAAGSAALLLGEAEAGAVLLFAAGLGLLALTLAAARRRPETFTAVMSLGAALWPFGTWRWLAGAPVAEVSHVWLAFLVVTVAAERIELSRLARPGPLAIAALWTILAALVGALVLGQPFTGTTLHAGALAALALWLAATDVARSTIRGRGFPRFSAACLFAGYGWLLVAAAVLAALPPALEPAGRDAAVHAIGLGFVLSMVFAHAPIVLPAVTGAPVRYAAPLWIPAALLQVAVAARVGGAVADLPDLVAAGAVSALAALALYAILVAGTALVRPAPRSGGARP